VHARRIGLFALFAVVPGLVSAQVSRCANTLVTGNRVGRIRLGMTIADLRNDCSILRDTIEVNEGEAGRVVYALVAHDTVRLDVLHDSVRFIRVHGPRFVTPDSIHAGMPLFRFLIGRQPRVLVGEGKVYLRDPQHCGISFGLSPEAYAHAPKLTTAALARLPRSTTIDEILVTGPPTGLPNERCN
jgi:hypothetical protein